MRGRSSRAKPCFATVHNGKNDTAEAELEYSEDSFRYKT